MSRKFEQEEMNFIDEFTLRLAEEVCVAWRSFRESPKRTQHKIKIQAALHKAIVEELVIATTNEMNGIGAKPLANEVHLR